MLRQWPSIRGCARGPVTRMEPHVRIACAAAVLMACLVAPATTAPGITAMVTTVLLWGAACRPPGRMARTTLLLGLSLFLPYLLLVPVIHGSDPGTTWTEALQGPWAAALRGLSTMQVGAAAASTLSVSDLRRGLSRLHVPSALIAAVQQIVHQASTLVGETRQMAAAIAIRSGTARTWTAARVLMSVSRLWLPRVAARAERVAAAMELRGYCRSDLPDTDATVPGTIDALTAGHWR